MIRPEIAELVSLGPFPSSKDTVVDVIDRQAELLKRIDRPVSDEEARELVKLFGPDDYYGGAWTLVHLIETAPNWPLTDCLTDDSIEWIARLKMRVENARRMSD
jgi:hypothetical protein